VSLKGPRFSRRFRLQNRSSALWCHWHVTSATAWLASGVRSTVLLFRVVGKIFAHAEPHMRRCRVCRMEQWEGSQTRGICFRVTPTVQLYDDMDWATGESPIQCIWGIRRCATSRRGMLTVTRCVPRDLWYPQAVLVRR
jgi:hypothetical protein